MQIVPFFGGCAPPLPCCGYRKPEVLKGVEIEENVNKFMRPVGPSGVRTLEMYAGALEAYIVLPVSFLTSYLPVSIHKYQLSQSLKRFHSCFFV